MAIRKNLLTWALVIGAIVGRHDPAAAAGQLDNPKCFGSRFEAEISKSSKNISYNVYTSKYTRVIKLTVCNRSTNDKDKVRLNIDTEKITIGPHRCISMTVTARNITITPSGEFTVKYCLAW